MWDRWEPDTLENHRKAYKGQCTSESKKHKKGYVVLVLIVDFADQGDKVMHSSTHILTSLFVRGRHLGCACWLLTQN